MGVQLKSKSAEVRRAETHLNKLNEDLKLSLAQTAIDVAGVADPTPISDAIGAGLSLYRGDLIGAGLSLVSMIPYAGDALAKTAKGVRLAKRIASLKKKISAAIKRLNKAMKSARKEAAAAVRAKRKAAAVKKAAKERGSQPCLAKTNRFGSRLPADGSWRDEIGNSEWMPDPNTKEGEKILKATGRKPITFKDGYPDFSPYAKHKVEIDMKGNYSIDTASARDAMRKKLNDPNWEKPEGWTWHHKEDGVTMELVPYDLNKRVPHTGGASIVKDPGY